MSATIVEGGRSNPDSQRIQAISENPRYFPWGEHKILPSLGNSEILTAPPAADGQIEAELNGVSQTNGTDGIDVWPLKVLDKAKASKRHRARVTARDRKDRRGAIKDVKDWHTSLHEVTTTVRGKPVKIFVVASDRRPQIEPKFVLQEQIEISDLSIDVAGQEPVNSDYENGRGSLLFQEDGHSYIDDNSSISGDLIEGVDIDIAYLTDLSEPRLTPDERILRDEQLTDYAPTAVDLRQ